MRRSPAQTLDGLLSLVNGITADIGRWLPDGVPFRVCSRLTMLLTEALCAVELCVLERLRHEPPRLGPPLRAALAAMAAGARR